MKRFSIILIAAVLVFVFSGSVFAADEITTVYKRDGDFILDLEFNDASEYSEATFDLYWPTTGFEVPSDGCLTTTTLDGLNVGKVIYPGPYARINFTSATTVYQKLMKALKSGPVAFEVKSKTVSGNAEFMNAIYALGGTTFIPSGFTNDDLYNKWNTFTAVLDYSATTSNSNVKIDVIDSKLNGNAYTNGTHNTVAYNYAKALYTSGMLQFAFYGDNKAEHNEVTYIDYIRIYALKELKQIGVDADSEKTPQDTEVINVTFNSPLDADSARTAVKLINPDGREMNITSSVGSEENILSITLREPLEFSNCYKIKIEELLGDDNDLKYSGEYEFYVENEPLYSFENLNIPSKTIDVKNNIPTEQKLYFSTQMYNSEGKLLDAEFGNAATILKAEANSFKTVNFMTKGISADVKKIRLFVFDGSLTNVYSSFEQNL